MSLPAAMASVSELDPPLRHRRRLPAGRHGLPRAFVIHDQRERLLDAVAEMSSRKGYARTTIADIVEHAGVSKRTFYEHFPDKESCFLAGYTLVIGELIGAMTRAYVADGRPWADRVRAALIALLEALAAEPAFGRMCVVEVMAAGPRAIDQRDATLARFTAFLEPGRLEAPKGTVIPPGISEAVIGGLYEAIYREIVLDRAHRLPGLLPELLYCTLVPYLGHEAALAQYIALSPRD